jgi:kynurenine 3-monooxygenase
VPEIEVSYDYLIGADGAHSASRFHMMKFARVDYQQEYIDTLWCEFRIPPSEDGNFRISPNHLHIWPGREFMFIALPSADKSFTCTLFAPSVHYTALENAGEDIHAFFDLHFPGVCPELIDPEALSEQFNVNPHLPLISIKCKPHHFSASVAILGDSAHAVLPFYGQGLNAGLEDVRVLFEHLDKHGVYDKDVSVYTRSVRRQAAFQAYTDQRCEDTYAINDLSKENYLEMRWGVKSPLYKLRKSVEETLDRHLPSLGWKTQYARVSFSNQRYSEVVRAVARQSELLGMGLSAALVASVGAVSILMWKYPRGFSPVRFFWASLRYLSSIW